MQEQVEKSITLPPVDQLHDRLKRTHLPLRHAGVLNRFITSVAGSEACGSTLSSAWESACRDALKRLPREVDLPLTALLHVYAFPAVARALVPDPKVAQDAVDDLHLQWDIHDLWKKFKFLR